MQASTALRIASATASPMAGVIQPAPTLSRKVENGLCDPSSAFTSGAPASTATSGSKTVSTLISPAQRMVRATSLGASCISSAKYTALPKPL